KHFDNHVGDQYQSAAIITVPDYFRVFPYRWLAGNAAVLDRQDELVLTESRGRLYFGNIPPAEMVGKMVVYDDSLQVHVGGVVRDLAGNTDMGYTDFISIATATHSFLKDWIPTADWKSLRPHQSMAWVKLAKGVTAGQVNASFAEYIRQHPPRGRGTLNFYLQPLEDIHFTRNFHRGEGDMGDDGDMWRKPYLPELDAMIGVAIFILLIAAINFINLSTAQSMSRAKEVGVRKVMGSRVSHLRFQFLVETMLVVLLAVILAVSLVNPVLHLFQAYLPRGVRFELAYSGTLAFLAGLILVTTLLAGAYPAWVMARYRPVESLKGEISGAGPGSLHLRRALIVFQFTVSLVFIIGAIVVGKQITYMRVADKGFNTDRILTLTSWNSKPEQLREYANAIRQLPDVAKVILEGAPPMGFAQGADLYADRPAPDANRLVHAEMGDEDYIPFYGMRLVAGRNVFHSDSLRELVINETMAKTMGCRTPKEALGRVLYQVVSQGKLGKGYPVVGVVADFHEGSFHDPIPPTVIENVKDRQHGVAIQLINADPRTVKAVVAGMREKWKERFPDQPFQAAFLTESIDWLFHQEEDQAWLVNAAMGVTIFISCMGLFGLGLFTVRRRSKEISIRKVLGASVTGITTLLTADFAWLVGLAFCVASPLGWYLARTWLEDFAYRTGLNWWVFAAAGLAALVIAMLTVGFQAAKTAMASPVKYLRNE
ncbi:MAG TPA: FtsX-like permease family protein, partial [Puia sp.]|nr:FtsX-like permease family protein [Puia sp.]